MNDEQRAEFAHIRTGKWWAWFAEDVERRTQTVVGKLATAKDPVDIYRLQGALDILNHLVRSIEEE